MSLDDLPSDLVDMVLVRMPLRDAVRTSILSRGWRYKWASMTELEFRWFFNPDGLELSNIIDQVLMLHVGTIPRFAISADGIPSSKIDQWLIFLSRNGIKKLVLDLATVYSVHSCVFYCQSITLLDLHNCAVKLPPSFEGLRNLSVLELQDIQMSKDDLQILISNCALLEELVLYYIVCFDCFKISSPRLRCLRVEAFFIDFSLVKTPSLSALFFDLLEFDPLRDGGIYNLSKILSCANSIKRLELRQYATDFLAVGCRPEKLFLVFECLHSLKLSICFTEMEQVSLLLCLLRSSPCLRELKLFCSNNIGDGAEVVDQIWEVSEDVDVLVHLKFLKIIHSSCIKPEMEFIKYVLGHAPVLQRMEISFVYSSNGTAREQFLIQLMRFQRASRQAEIIYIE